MSSCSSLTPISRNLLIILGSHWFLERRAPAPFKKNPAAEGSDGGVLIRLCHYIRGQKHWRCSQRLGGAQIFRGRFASPAIRDDFERNLLPLVEGAHPCTFDRADMDEDILAALVRLNKAKTLLVVKPLHCSRSHGRSSFKYVCIWDRTKRDQLSRDLGEDR